MSKQTDQDDVIFAPATTALGLVLFFGDSPYMGGFLTLLGTLWTASVYYRVFWGKE